MIIWAVSCDFQQCGILTSVDSDEPVQSPLKRRNSKWCSVSSLTVIEYSSDKQRLWPDCAYAQADPRLCWSHIPHCWKSHALAHLRKKAFCLTWAQGRLIDRCFSSVHKLFPPLNKMDARAKKKEISWNSIFYLNHWSKFKYVHRNVFLKWPLPKLH